MENAQPDDRRATENDALDSLIGYNLRRATSVMLNDFTTQLADSKLRPVTFGMVIAIDEKPGISSAELGRWLGIKSANMVPLLAELEKAGLIRRGEHRDRRMQVLFLTELASNALPRWRQQAMEHEDRVLSRLDAGERLTLLRLLGQVWRGENE